MIACFSLVSSLVNLMLLSTQLICSEKASASWVLIVTQVISTYLNQWLGLNLEVWQTTQTRNYLNVQSIYTTFLDTRATCTFKVLRQSTQALALYQLPSDWKLSVYWRLMLASMMSTLNSSTMVYWKLSCHPKIKRLLHAADFPNSAGLRGTQPLGVKGWQGNCFKQRNWYTQDTECLSLITESKILLHFQIYIVQFY